LRDKAKVMGSMILESTHQEIAADLHTSRVVISRMLKKLEMRELIKPGRNRLELLSLH
ncbi:MAG TPA: helix-turn-helix domain-containing protein, partial [Bacteroidetes bacterium]|nr:helix-turn-helix domain-containing protein [Bacteroidota bacterium]